MEITEAMNNIRSLAPYFDVDVVKRVFENNPVKGNPSTETNIKNKKNEEINNFPKEPMSGKTIKIVTTLFIVIFAIIMITEWVLCCICISFTNGEFKNIDHEFTFINRVYMILIIIFTLLFVIVVIAMGLLAYYSAEKITAETAIASYSKKMSINYGLTVAICVIMMIFELILLVVICVAEYHVRMELKNAENGNTPSSKNSPTPQEIIDSLKQIRIYNIVMIILSLLSIIFPLIFFIMIIVRKHKYEEKMKNDNIALLNG